MQNDTNSTGQIGGAVLPNGTVNGQPANPLDVPKASTTFNASDIPGSSPFSIPTYAPSGTATAVSASAQNSVDQAAKDVQAEKNAAGVGQAQTQKNSMLDYIKGLYGQESDVTTNQTNQYSPQIDTENKNLTDINNQIADLTVRQRAEKDAISGNGGLSAEGQRSALGEVDNKYGRQLADLAIRQSASTGNVARLTQALKDSISLKTAPLEQEISYYKDFGIQNLDQMSKNEQDTLNNIITEKSNLLTQTTTQETAKANLLTTALQAGVKLTDAQTQQVMNAPDAATAASYLASQGISLQPNAYTAVTNPITGAQTSFNTKTGQFGASTGGFNVPSSTGGSSGSSGSSAAVITPQSNPEQFKDGVPITAEAANSLGGIYSAAWDTVNGLKAPGQTSFRGAAAMTALTSAQDRISQALFGHNYDAAAAQNAFNFRNSETYQKYTANAPIAISTITKIADLASKLGLTSFSPINTAKINVMAMTGNADAKTLQSLLSVSADDIGLLLGAGSGSDFKTKLGSVIFNADGSVNQTNTLATAIQDRIQSKLQDYYTKAGVTDASQYAKLDTIKLAGQTPVQPKEGDTHVYNGVTYKVVNGNWTQQ